MKLENWRIFPYYFWGVVYSRLQRALSSLYRNSSSQLSDYSTCYYRESDLLNKFPGILKDRICRLSKGHCCFEKKGRNSILWGVFIEALDGKTPPLAPNKKAQVATIESDDNGPMTREQPSSTARCAAKHRSKIHLRWELDFWLNAWLEIFFGFLIVKWS